MLLAGVAQHDGHMGLHGHQAGQHQHLHVAAVELAAEGAADGGGHDAHLLVAQVHGGGNVLLAVGGGGAGGNEVERVVLPLGHYHGSLEGHRVLAVVHAGGDIDDIVGLGEALFDVAGLKVEVLLVGGDVAREDLVELGGVRLQGVVHVEHGREHLIVHVDELAGLLGDVLGLGHDQGHGVAHEADVLVQHVGVARRGVAVVDAEVGVDVRVGDDALHAGHGHGAGVVDAADAREGVGAVQDLTVVHVGRVEVAGVHGLAGEDVLAQDALGLAADVTHFSHCLPSSFARRRP